jgi:hypothetical protein
LSSTLSSCRDRSLGSSAIGACDDDALQLCSEQTKVDDIISCLHENESSLSDECLVNIMNSNAFTNGWLILRNHYRHITKSVAIMSLVYLSLPFLISIWALYKYGSLKIIQDKVLQTILSHSYSLTDLENNSSHQPSQPDESAVDIDSQLDIGFMDVSYWIEANRSLRSICLGSKDTAKKQILHNVREYLQWIITCNEISYIGIRRVLPRLDYGDHGSKWIRYHRHVNKESP